MNRFIGGIGMATAVAGAVLAVAAFRPSALAAVSVNEADQVAGGQHVPCGSHFIGVEDLTCEGLYFCEGMPTQCPSTGKLVADGPGWSTSQSTPCAADCGNECGGTGIVSCLLP